MGFRIGRGGGTGRHAVLRGPWAIACVGSNPTLGTNRPVWIAGRRSQVVKAEVCKTSIGGSNPPVASKMKMIKPSKDGLANGQPVLAFHGPGTYSRRLYDARRFNAVAGPPNRDGRLPAEVGGEKVQRALPCDFTGLFLETIGPGEIHEKMVRARIRVESMSLAQPS